MSVVNPSSEYTASSLDVLRVVVRLEGVGVSLAVVEVHPDDVEHFSVRHMLNDQEALVPQLLLDLLHQLSVVLELFDLIVLVL